MKAVIVFLMLISLLVFGLVINAQDPLAKEVPEKEAAQWMRITMYSSDGKTVRRWHTKTIDIHNPNFIMFFAKGKKVRLNVENYVIEQVDHQEPEVGE